MKRLTLTLALVVLATRAFCWSKQIDFDCGELAPTASQSYVQTFPVRNKFVGQLVVAIKATNIGTEKVPKCHVDWTVSGRSGSSSRVLFHYADEREYSLNGVSFEGTSPDGSKVLLDFFTAAGDFTGHRPVVYDFLAGSWQIRTVDKRITRSFPSCNYFTMIGGVNNQGDVVLYVPKSIVDAQCPDQGEWLLNMKTDAVVHLEAHAPPETQSPR